MEILSIEHQIILYESIYSIDQFPFNNFNKIFYCGATLDTMNGLLLVIDNDINHIYYENVNSILGVRQISSSKNLPLNPYNPNIYKYLYYAKIITKSIYDQYSADWDLLADHTAIYSKNKKFIPGIDITNTCQKFHKLKVFL